MKIRYALLGAIVVAALVPDCLWAESAGSASGKSLQQSALGPGASEQQRANAPLGRSAGAPSQPGQGAAVGPLSNNANRGTAAAPAGGTQLSAAARKSKQQAAIAPVRSSQVTNRATASKVPGAAALPGSIKARANGATVAQHHNAIGTLTSAQNGGPMPTHTGPGAVAAREPLVPAALRPGPSGLGGGAPLAPANAAARHSPVRAAVGGAPAYEPPRNATLAVIGATMMKRNKL